MQAEKYKMRVIVTALSLLLMSLGGLVFAQAMDGGRDETQFSGKAQANALQHINDASAVIKRMENEPGMNKLLEQAKGIFIVPEYGRTVSGIGDSGAAGVLLAKNNGTWGEPAIYDVGGISIGTQAGTDGGPIVLILTSDKAVNSFRQKNNFALSAEAGLMVVDWTRVVQGTAGTGDIVAWSSTKGLFGGATVGVQDIRFNQEQTGAYYKRDVAANEIIRGQVQNPHADVLKQALAGIASDAASGSSGSTQDSASGSGQGSSEQGGGSPSGTSDSNR